ncbi:hypothetical protein ACIJEF_001589 [Enterococcus faecalis]
MKLKADFFPYPVLNQKLDDYVDSSFTTKVTIDKLSDSTIKLNIEFSLDNQGLQRLIEENKACFSVHLEGVSSSFRKLYKLNYNESDISIELDSAYVSKSIEVNSMIIANDDILEYRNEKFNSLYYDKSFSIDVFRADILAFDNMKEINLEFSNRENLDAKSIIRISSKNQSYMTIDSDGDVIQVYIPEQDYNAYVNLSKLNETKQKLLLVTIVLPTLTYVINQMKSNEVDEEKEWVILLNEKMEDLKIDIKSSDSICIAQQLLNFPFENSLYDFYQMEENLNV